MGLDGCKVRLCPSCVRAACACVSRVSSVRPGSPSCEFRYVIVKNGATSGAKADSRHARTNLTVRFWGRRRTYSYMYPTAQLPHLPRPCPHAKYASCTLHLEVIELARLRARHESRPVQGDAQKRARSVEGAALLEAQRRAVALGELVVLVESTVALLQQRKRACEASVKVRKSMSRGSWCQAVYQVCIKSPASQTLIV